MKRMMGTALCLQYRISGRCEHSFLFLSQLFFFLLSVEPVSFHLICAILNWVLLYSLFEVWPVTVKPRGLGSSKSLTGESRLCLTASSLILVRVGGSSDLPSVTIPLLSVRRFGHLDGSFYLELGRSSPSGAGEVWMEAKDQGDCK